MSFIRKKSLYNKLFILKTSAVLFAALNGVSVSSADIDSNQKNIVYKDVKYFELDAEDLGGALVEFAIQSGASVFVESKVVEGYESTGVKGELPDTVALERLLRSTPFTFEYDSENNSFRVVKRVPKSAPP